MTKNKIKLESGCLTVSIRTPTTRSPSLVQHDRVEVQRAPQRWKGRRTDGAAQPDRAATHRAFGCVHCNKIGNPGVTRSSVLHPAARAGATPPRAERGRAVALQQTRAWVTSPACDTSISMILMASMLRAGPPLLSALA